MHLLAGSLADTTAIRDNRLAKRRTEPTRRDTRCVSPPPFLSGDTRERAAVAGKRETAASVARRAARSNVIRARARARERASGLSCSPRQSSLL